MAAHIECESAGDEDLYLALRRHANKIELDYLCSLSLLHEVAGRVLSLNINSNAMTDSTRMPYR